MRAPTLVGLTLLTTALALPTDASASDCDDAQPEWLLCEDFEQGGLGWESWFDQSDWLECTPCTDGVNDPARIRLDDTADAHDGSWSVHMPAEASAGYQGGTLHFRTCEGESQSGCTLAGHDELYFRTWVKLAPDHEYVHHFLGIGGTRPDQYWEYGGNAGCRPNGSRWAGTTVDFKDEGGQHELYFYTYWPEMECAQAGGWCTNEMAQNICNTCAGKDMPCQNGLECCYGNVFRPEPAVILAKDQWVCLEMGMEINTPGEADGTMAFWVDDELAHEVTGMHWRDVPELQLNGVTLAHYISGGDADQPNRVWFDDVIVSTSRIGCDASMPPATDSGADDAGDDASGTGNGSAGDGASDGGSNGTSGGSASDGGTSGADGGGSSGDGDSGSGGCGCRSTGGGWVGSLAILALIGMRLRQPRSKGSHCATVR